VRGREGRVVRRLGGLVQLRLQLGHPRRQRRHLRHQFRVDRQCRVQLRPEHHDKRVFIRIGKLAEVGERWSLSHLYLDSHSRSPIKKNQYLGIKLAKDTVRGADRWTPGEQLRIFLQKRRERLAPRSFGTQSDAERLSRDPAMRTIVDRKGLDRRAASTSQMGRFETEWLATEENLAVLSDLSGIWIDRVHDRKKPKIIILDMDSSERNQTQGELFIG
jgi:hypothetical protein